MRSYGEYCALAKALDVIGDRWSLLVIRELALRGPCRYTDLQEGLPGVSTNLLADRLRELEDAGVIVKREPRPPLATPVFELTEHGRGLEPILRALMGWGTRYMVDGPAPGDHFRSRWLTWPVETFLHDGDPGAPPARVEVHAGDGEPIAIDVGAGRVSVSAAPDARPPDASISGDPHAVLGLLAGYLDLDAARAAGVEVGGSAAVVERVLPAVQSQS